MTVSKSSPRTALQRQPSCPVSSSFPAIPPVVERRSMANRARGWRQLLCGGIAVALLTGGGGAIAEPIAAKPPSVAATADQVAGFVAESSQRFGIPASWIRAVMRAESFGDVRALSPKGAMGLMQIMPATWAGLRLRYGLGADPYNAHDNIIAGAAYLRELHDRYGAPGFLAAYNAGPARYEDHLATGRPLPAETRAYVALLTPLIGGGSVDDELVVAVVARSWTQAPLFAARARNSPAHAQTSPAQQSEQPSISATAEDWTALAPQSDGLFVRTSGRNPRP